MIVRLSSKPAVQAPPPIIIKGKWINGGGTFRAWYASHGKIKIVDADGPMSWQIENALRRQSALVAA
jgi:hypothetical protein